MHLFSALREAAAEVVDGAHVVGVHVENRLVDGGTQLHVGLREKGRHLAGNVGPQGLDRVEVRAASV